MSTVTFDNTYLPVNERLSTYLDCANTRPQSWHESVLELSLYLAEINLIIIFYTSHTPLCWVTILLNIRGLIDEFKLILAYDWYVPLLPLMISQFSDLQKKLGTVKGEINNIQD